MAKKKKAIQKNNKSDNEIDPFDGLQRPALKNMIDMMTWHYRMKPNQLPTFLHEYRVIHFIGAEKQLDADFSVYELYHCILQSHSDRNSLSACISKGETIAIWEKEKPTAISAITFLQRENSVLVLFLATLVEYQNAGMCTFLLSIMHQVVNCRVRCNGVNVFLKANPKANEAAWRYYKGRNFSELKEDRKAFPKVLTDCFADEVDDSPLKDYLVFSKDLKWLTICLTREYFALPLDVDQKRVKERLFYNPTDETIHCPCLYAAFPGNLTYDDVAHCTLNYNEYSEKFWDAKAFHPSTSSDTQNQELYQGPTARFTWIERCLRRKGDSLSPDLLGIALAWLQRYSKAEIWSTMTIIPTAVMTEVFVMQTVFTLFIEGRNYLSQLPPEMEKRSKAEKRDLAKHIFHFDIDSKRFMEASIPVVEYILQNKALFAKPFIAMAAQNYKDYSWTAFMAAVNCEGIKNNEKDRMCGYFLFDPTGRRNPRDPPMQCKFFLKLAHLILNDEMVPLSRQKGEKSPWKDSVIAPWFTTLHEFYKRFTRQTLNFGCVMTDKDNEKCDIEDGRFRLLKLPPGYMFCSTKGGDVQENEGHEDRPGDVNPNVKERKEKERKEKLETTHSGIKSLIFIHDFGMMVHNVTFENIGNVKGDMTFDDNGVVLGMGRQIPHSKRMFNQYIHDVQMSLYQLTDRIASTQMGLVREESDEYEEYLRPGKTVERRMLLGAAIQMPKPEEAFPDLAKYKKWKPPLTERPQTLITAGSQECQRNEVESPNNRMRKPRRKDKEKKARAEQEAKSPRRSKDGEDHDEVHGTSTLKQTPHKKKKAIAEMQPAQDKHPATEMPRKIPQRETRQTIAGASHSIEFLPCTDNIDECTSTFRNEFQKATSEQMKKNLCWKAFALLHNKTPMPAFVDNTLNSIRASLEKEERNDSIVEVIGEKDVLCGRGARLCMAYLNRTMELREIYSSAKSITERKEVMSTIYMALKEEGFRFLDERIGGRGWKERTNDSAIAYIKRRMIRVTEEKKGDDMGLSMKSLEATIGPFESEVLPANGIINHQDDVPKGGHNPNQILRREIRARATSETFARATEDEERNEIAAEVMHEMEKKGLIFVYKKENLWKTLETKEVIKDIRIRLLKARRHWLQKGKTTGKRKAGDENATHHVGDHAKRTNDGRCIECETQTNHSCRKCKRCVCSMCCQSKRDLEMAWWCEECFKTLGSWDQMLIRQGNYSTSDDEETNERH